MSSITSFNDEITFFTGSQAEPESTNAEPKNNANTITCNIDDVVNERNTLLETMSTRKSNGPDSETVHTFSSDPDAVSANFVRRFSFISSEKASHGRNALTNNRPVETDTMVVNK